MARKAPKNRMKEGGMIDMPEQSKHEKMVSEMHDALYSLGDRIREPMERPGDKLLPEHLKKSPTKHGAMAKKQIECLHRAFKEEK